MNDPINNQNTVAPMTSNDNEKPRKAKGLIVLITILVIALLGLGSYIVYDKILAKEKCTNEEKTNDNTNDNNEENKESEKDNTNNESTETPQAENKFPYSLSERKSAQWILSTSGIRIYADIDGSIYLDYYCNENNEETYNHCKNIMKDAKSHQLKGATNEYAEDGGINSKKLDIKNVVYIFYISSLESPSVGDGYVLMLKEDGTISMLDLYKMQYEGKIDFVDNFNSLKNIINVIVGPGGYESVIVTAIDAQGKEHTLKF